MTDSPFASPIGLSRDPHWDDAWTKGNTYVLPHPDNEFETLKAGRASELGKTISNTFSLNRWHKEMVFKGLLIRKSILQRGAIALKELAKPQSAIWALCDEAEEVAGTKEPAAIGTGFHKLTELFDAGKIGMHEAPEPWDRDLVAYAELLLKCDLVAVPELTERIVWNRTLNIAGRFDRLWRYLKCCDKWHVGDVKTGRYLDAGWHEIPIQLDCYAGATHLFDVETEKWSPMPETCRRAGLVLHVPSDGKKDENREPTGDRLAALYEVKLDSRIRVPVEFAAWPTELSPAELAKAVQAWQKTKRIATMVARVEVTPDGEVVDSPLTITERIDLAASEAELQELRSEALSRREWKGHHTTRARERLEVLAS
jgi:hypothetical protein